MITKTIVWFFATTLLSTTIACRRSQDISSDYHVYQGLVPMVVEFGGARKIDEPWMVKNGIQHFSLLYKGDDRAFDFSKQSSVRLVSENMNHAFTTLIQIDKSTETQNVPGGYRFFIEAHIELDSKLCGQSLFIEVLGPNESVVFRKRFIII